MINKFILKALPVVVTAALFFMHEETYAQQNVGIGITTPAASAILDLTATDKGMLVPRMSTAQRVAIASPAQGLLVFDTNFNQFWFFDGTIWNPVAAGVCGPTGPSGTDGATGGVGPQGPQGIQGIQGPTGPSGTDGADGGVGPQGPQGIQGIQGIQGPTGPSGTNGAAGAVGPQGIQGPVGLTGPTGPVGCSSPNYVMKSDGTAATCGIIYDNGINIGIGNAAPAQKLDVSGAVQFSGAIMPAGNPGISGKVLSSNGPGLAPSWVGAVMPSQIYSCESTGTLSVTTSTYAVIPGETLTIPNLAVGDRIMLFASGNALMTTTDYCIMDVAMFMDGVMIDVGGFVRYSLDYDYAYVMWQNFNSIARYTVATAGSHTFDVRARMQTTGGTVSIGGDSTNATEGVFMIFVLKN